MEKRKMNCVFERNIYGNTVMIFQEDEHFEIFLNGKFSASCDTVSECLNELATEIEIIVADL